MYADPVPLPATFWDDFATRSELRPRAAMRIADQPEHRPI